MYDEIARPAHVQLCTYVEARGQRVWQCTRPDPHPDVGHQLPPDAELGRILHEQSPDWLAGQLRDRIVLVGHLQRRIDELQSVAADLAGHWVAAREHSAAVPDLTGDRTRMWIRRNLPGIARRLGYDS